MSKDGGYPGVVWELADVINGTRPTVAAGGKVPAYRTRIHGTSVSVPAGIGDYRSAIGCDTVSYTHLRAHETVIDIGCRLLLEKKKCPGYPANTR